MTSMDGTRALCCALGLGLLIISGGAAAQEPASTSVASTPLTPTARRLVIEQRVEPAPSAFWLVAGITLGAGSLAMNIDSARRFDDGDRTCFPLLEPGGCLVEALVAGPVGLLGGLSLVLYGLWLGEHDASVALANGQPLEDHSSLETWSLIALIGGYAIAVGINYYAIARLYSDYDQGACEEAAREDRSDRCAGGKIFGLSIVQSVAFAIAMIAAEPLGYTQGYDAIRRRQAKKARATILPWASRDAFGLAVGLRL
jgi:hypothetical protein